MSVEPATPRAATGDHIPLDVAARAAEADLPTGSEKTALVRSMFDAIAPRYDLVNRLMTFGLDQRWRRDTLTALALPAGSLLLDLACGPGALSPPQLPRPRRNAGRNGPGDPPRGSPGAARGRRPDLDRAAERLRHLVHQG